MNQEPKDLDKSIMSYDKEALQKKIEEMKQEISSYSKPEPKQSKKSEPTILAVPKT